MCYERRTLFSWERLSVCLLCRIAWDLFSNLSNSIPLWQSGTNSPDQTLTTPEFQYGQFIAPYYMFRSFMWPFFLFFFFIVRFCFVFLFSICIFCVSIALCIVSSLVSSCLSLSLYLSPIFVQVYWPLPSGGNPTALMKYVKSCQRVEQLNCRKRIKFYGIWLQYILYFMLFIALLCIIFSVFY